MAEKDKNDVFKLSKNPLLSGAGFNFPFENFSNSALLVPVPLNNDQSLEQNQLPDGEGDSFLGQDEPPSSAPLSRPSSQPQPLQPPQPQAPPSSSFFSQFAKFALSSQASPEQQPPNTNYNGSESIYNRPPVNQAAQNFYNPIHATPICSPIVNPAAQPPQHQQQLNFQPFIGPVDNSVVTTIDHIASKQDYQANTLGFGSGSGNASSGVEDQLSSVPLLRPSDHPSLITPELNHNQPPPPPPPPRADLGSSPHNQNYRLFQPSQKAVPDQIFQPHLFRPVSPSTAQSSSEFPHSSSSLPAIPFYSPSSAPLPSPQPVACLFPVENAAPVQPPPPPPAIPLDKPPLVDIPIQSAAPLATAAPPKGGQSNIFRLGNLKRPTYAQPPDLTAFAPAVSMATVPDPVLPSHSPASLFIPQTPATTPARAEGNATQRPSDQRTMPADTTDTAVGTALPSYQSPVPGDQASPPTVMPLPPTAVTASYGQTYRPPYHHWFFRKQRKSGTGTEDISIWQPMSMVDSLKLEEAFTSLEISPDTKVATDGGRYDVDVLRRQRSAVYWEEEPGEVRRCSWFVKGSLDARYIPYEEKIATMLEEEYRIASTTNEWNRRIALPDGEEIILHSASAIAHHLRSSSPDAWGNPPQMQRKPRVVKRGLDEFHFPEDEPETVDHLLFLVHGIGQFCDLKFRLVTEVVDDFRSISLQLLQSHFRGATEMGTVNRVEMLPISWHKALHTEDIDKKLHNITLSSIHRLRQFTNDTLLDILFYTSPVFCETIVQAVGNEMNRLYTLFKQRNPQFKGGVSLGGHSLGSLILFDMLCNQMPDLTPEDDSPNSVKSDENAECEEVNKVGCLKSMAKLNRGVSYLTIGKSGTGQPYIRYPQLIFHPKNFFALGSPIGMFVTVRGIDSLAEDFRLPTCPGFYNIFHPFDPVAYRVETLIRPELHGLQPVLIPHHKGRKRMHLELKDTMAHMGAALKQRLMDSVRTTWNTFYQMTMFHRTDDNEIEQEVNKVLEDQLMRQQAEQERVAADQQEGLDVTIGSLNRGRRIDYVLQEAPLESFNEYIFALSSHVCYWESEDTMLMMLKEIYATMEITPDNQVLQQILPFDSDDHQDGPSLQFLPLAGTNDGLSLGMDPTVPPADNAEIGPPPVAGFVRK